LEHVTATEQSELHKIRDSPDGSAFLAAKVIGMAFEPGCPKMLVKTFTKSLHPFRGLRKVRARSLKTNTSRLTLKPVRFQISA
jgi:hypothetical protein